MYHLEKAVINQMWYLVLRKESSLRISYGVVYLAFLNYEEAEEYAKKKGIDGIITDDLTPFFNF